MFRNPFSLHGNHRLFDFFGLLLGQVFMTFILFNIWHALSHFLEFPFPSLIFSHLEKQENFIVFQGCGVVLSLICFLGVGHSTFVKKNPLDEVENYFVNICC
jgi:hypothetical protein